MKPMLAKIGDVTVLGAPGYIYEPKLDGIRALLHYGKNPTFESRNGKDLTARFSTIRLPPLKASTCVIDGEIVMRDRRLLHLDETEIMAKANECARRLVG